MNIKRYLPLIVLTFVSLFVFLCGLGTAWFFWQGSKTLADKIQVIARWGTLFALVMVALLWAGIGMDRLFARLKQRSTRIRPSVLSYIFLPILSCIGLFALTAVLIYLSFMFPKGWNWTQLPAPPDPAVEVAAGKESFVTIRTDAESYFSCQTNSPSRCWQDVPAPEQRFTIWETELTTPPVKPPKGVISILGISYRSYGTGWSGEGQTWYAVLEDGSVWYMERNPDPYDAGMAAGFFLLFGFIPAIAGLLVVYLGAGLSAWTRSMSNQNTANLA